VKIQRKVTELQPLRRKDSSKTPSTYECLNRFVIFGERHLRYLIRNSWSTTWTERFHQGIGGQLIRNQPGSTNDNGTVGGLPVAHASGASSTTTTVRRLSLGDEFRTARAATSSTAATSWQGSLSEMVRRVAPDGRPIADDSNQRYRRVPAHLLQAQCRVRAREASVAFAQEARSQGWPTNYVQRSSRRCGRRARRTPPWMPPRSWNS